MHSAVSVLLAAILAANNSPSLGDMGAWYFDTLKQSQVWINLQPQGVDAGPDPVRLNVTVSFPGRALEHAPATVEVRAEPVAGTFPLRIRQPILRVALDAGVTLDFTGPGHAFQFVSRCPECSSDTVIARVPFSVLRDAAASQAVTVEALGFSTRMKPADLVALRRFVDTVSGGIVVQ